MAISTNGTVLTRLAGALYNTQMSNATYKEVAALDPSSLANVLYARDFNMVSDASVATTLVANLGLASVTGLNNWVAAQLTAAGANKGAKVVELLNGFAQMSADATYGAAATAFNTKIDSALALSQTADNAGGTFDAISTAVAGKAFALTTGTDAFTGTANSDTFNAVLQDAGAAGTTIQPGDVVNGASGTDTLSISVAGDIGTTSFTISAVQTNSVENVLAVNFNTDDATDLIVATNLMTGLTTIGSSASSASGDTQFAGMKNMVAAEMSNGAGDLTLTYDGAQVVTGTADSQTLNVSNMTAGTFTANGIETLNINTGLVKSTLAAAASNALKTVNVTGATDLKITAALDFASNGTATAPGAVVNASTFTGKLSITTTANEVLSVTGGSGDDTFTLGSLTKDDVVVGGAGNDTVNIPAATLTTQFAKVSGVEKVAFNAGVADAAMDVSKLSAGVTTVEMNLSDDTDGGDVNITGTISNLSGQAVNLKHTVANAADTSGGDGTAYTITNAVDTSADAINITLDAIGVTSTANNSTSDFGIDVLNVANFETVNLTSKKSTSVTANEVRSLTDTLATTLTINGDADLTITQTGSALTALNASALDGKLNATLGANKVTVTGGAKDDTIVFAGNLNNDDVVDGGAGKDTLTATVTGLTATTGALRIANVEAVTLTTSGANTLNLAGVTGATSVAVSANAQTITGLALATKLIATSNASLTVTGADETGADDTLTVEQKLDGDVSNTIKTAATLENLNIVLNDTGATVNAATLVLTDAAAKKITVSEAADTVTTGTTVALGTLNKSVTTVDTSGVKGTQAFSVANTLTGATLTLSGAAAATVTGTSVNDTINVTSTGAVTHVIDAGAGTADVVNLAVKTGFVNIGSITNAETINVTVAAGNSIDLSGASFATSARAVNILGGNSASTFTTQTVVTEVTSVNAGSFGGNLLATFGANTFDSTVTVTGGALATDQVTASYSTAATYTPKAAGVEVLVLSASDAATTAASYTVDLSGTTGVSRINASVGNADTLVIDKATTQSIRVIDMQNDNGAVTLEYKLADATGTADSVTFDLLAAAATNIDDGAILKTTDIETINLKASSAESISLASLAMTDATKFESLVVTGSKALTVSALNANVTSINASGMTTGGSFIQTGRSQTTAANYVGSLGDDTFRMAHGNDVIDGAAGTGDTLVVTGNLILGGIQIDLSATGDQVTTFNGSANAAIQTGFENIDLSGITGTAGADITAAKTGSTITGTLNADQINGGAGADTIIVNTGTVANSDVIIGGGGTDTLQIAAGLTYTQSTDASLATVEVISLIDTGSAVLTGQTEAFTINGGTGVNTITGGSGADTIIGGDGIDALTGGAGVDTFVFAAIGSENDADTIADFTVGAAGDKLNLDAALAALATVKNTLTADLYVSPSGAALALEGTSIAVSNQVIIINSGATAVTGYDNAAEVVALLANSGDWDAVDFAASATGYLLAAANDGTAMYLWQVVNDATAAVAAGELTLVGVITVAADGIDALAAANFVLV